MINITFPDGSVREFAEGVTGLQIAESISQRLAQEVLAIGVNGETQDLSLPSTLTPPSNCISLTIPRANMHSGTPPLT